MSRALSWRSWPVAVAALAAVLLPAAPAAGQQIAEPASQRVVAEIRVHGNHTIPDEEVLALAGLSVGDELADNGEVALQERLAATGRFTSVRVLVRYRRLDQSGPVVLIVSVQEKESVASKLLFLPETRYTEDEGFSYGGRVSARNLFGGGEFISVPLTWGGVRRAALEVRRDWPGGFTVGGQLEARRWENPHFEAFDRRTGGRVFVERRFGERLSLRVHGGRHQVRFGDLEESLGRFGARAQLDTRPDASFPWDAVWLWAGVERLSPGGADGAAPAHAAGSRAGRVNRFRFSASAYRTLVGPAVLAVRAWLQLSSGPLPLYERLLVGGMASLRGWEAGSFSGDNAALTTVEVRIPLTSPLGAGRSGVVVFWDTASVWDDGLALGDVERRHGVGAGLFAMLTALRLNLDVASNLQGDVRVHFGTGFRF